MAEPASDGLIRVVQAAASLDGWGGIEKCVVNLQKHLPRDQFKVTVCAGASLPLSQNAGPGGLVTCHRSRSFIGRLQSYRRLFSSVQPDVIHAHFSPDFFAAGLAAQVCRVPAKVLTRHLAIPWAFHKSKIYGKLFPTIVCVSEAVKDQLILSGIDKTQLTVIYGGIDPPHSVSDSHATGPRSQLIYLGRLVPEKGLETLVRAVKDIPGTELQIWGEGPYESSLRSLISTLNLNERVKVMGFSFDIGSVFNPESILIVPSECDDALPTVVLEALSRKVPVIASCRGGIPEMIVHGQSGFLFRSGDVTELKIAIETLLKDHDLQERTAEIGYRLFEEKFTVQKMAHSYAKLYRGIL